MALRTESASAYARNGADSSGVGIRRRERDRVSHLRQSQPTGGFAQEAQAVRATAEVDCLKQFGCPSLCAWRGGDDETYRDKDVVGGSSSWHPHIDGRVQ